MIISRKTPIEYENLFFCFTIAIGSVSDLLRWVLNSTIGNTARLDTLFLYGLYALLFCKVLPRLLRSLNGIDLVFLSFLAVVFLTSSLRKNYNFTITANLMPKLLAQCLPFYFSAKLVHSSPKLNRYLRCAACILLLDVLRKMYLYRAIGIADGQHFLSEGYILLNALCLMLAPLVMEHKLIDCFLAGVILFAEVSTGARGPLLVAGLLFAAAILLLCRGKKYSKFLYMGLMICAVAIPLSAKFILPALARIMGSSGSLRSIESLLNGDFLKDDARITIASTSLDYIRDHLLIGSGVGNDRIFIHREVYWPAVNINGCYSHNFFLEIGMQFGLILGLFFCCLLAFLIIRRYNRSAFFQEKLLLIGFVFAGFLPLMISGSYLRWEMFYALIGFAARSDSFWGTSLNEQNS